MANLTIRNLKRQIIENLKRRAKHHGRSLEAEVREILRHAVEHEETGSQGLGTLIVSQFAGKGIGIDFEIPEWRGEIARPAKFR